jgi:two-component system sensor histidine kinase CpxA
MRTLFLRIFVWFWVASALLVALTVTTSPYWTRPPIDAPRQRAIDESMMLHGEAVEAIVRREGLEGLAGHLDNLGRRNRLRILVFDRQGREVYGRRYPPELSPLVRQTLEGHPPRVLREEDAMIHARPVSDTRGNRYAALVIFRRPDIGHTPLEPGTLVPRLLLMLLVVGGVCYLLARQLTSPVSRLRAAARKLTRGDLSARVGGTVSRRRDEIGDLARDFDSMAERIEALIGSQQRLLRDISHELRSPLTRLGVALELARQQAGDGAAVQLDRIERESERLNGLISQLLTVSRLETWSETLERTDLDMNAMLQGIVADASFEAEARGCRVELEAEDGCRYRGSADMLRSAVENVVRNAVHHTAEQSTVVVTLERSTGAAGPGLRLAVRDNGPGVDQDQLESLFRPFFRTTDARERLTGGSGLGLAISSSAIRAHGGSTRAENLPQGGLKVEINLPLGN